MLEEEQTCSAPPQSDAGCDSLASDVLAANRLARRFKARHDRHVMMSGANLMMVGASWRQSRTVRTEMA